ncbi:MAG: serine/threonine-protein kinase [Myxococcota bacterium]
MRERVARSLFDQRPPRKRTKSGRYQILGELGRGGMGVVYRAHDPKLRRAVALKALRLDRLGPTAQARMIREARAMARLSHPNVVGVHDVELDGPEGVVVVMEYVDGQTLRDWLQAKTRPWSAILPKFLAAGRGLAAAHAAGLLHRDFKPSNVLIGTDGRARVADFGLARAPVEDTTISHVRRRLTASLDSPLTTCGTMLGTPDFMAPEQLQGDDASALSDQYAFCVSLWWAIAGVSPFPAGPSHALAKLGGAPAWSGPRVPRHVVRALRRGLSSAPGDRWPSMEALLDALSRSERSRLGVGVQALSIAGLGLALLAIAPPAPPSHCDGATPLRPSWNDARRHAIERTMLDTERPYAAQAWARTEARLDHYAADWAAMYTQSCQTALGATSAVNLEPVPAMRCLQRSRLEFEATVERLAEPGSIERLDALLDELPVLERCRGTTEIPPHLIPPAHEADAVEDVLRTLATARSLRRAAQTDAALEQLEHAESIAQALSFDPILTPLEVERGLLMSALGQFEQAEAAYAAAQERGIRWEQWPEVASATRNLLGEVGIRQSRPKEALRLVELARGFAARTNDPGELARTMAIIGRVRSSQSDHETAIGELEEALWLWTTQHGENNESTAAIRHMLAVALSFQGRYEQAEREIHKALAIRQRLWGPRHPETAALRSDLGGIYQARGRLEAAERERRAALELLTELLGEDHPKVGTTSAGLAIILDNLDQLEQANQQTRHAIGVLERAGMSQTLLMGRVRGNFANNLRRLGRFDAAEQELRRSIAVLTDSGGPKTQYVGLQHRNLGDLLIDRGRFDEADSELRTALRILEAIHGKDGRELGLTHESLGLLAHQRGNDREALAELQTAAEILGRSQPPAHPLLLSVRARVAELLHTVGRADQAEAELQAILDVAGGSLTPEHEVSLHVHTLRGQQALERGDSAEARRILEQQWALYSEGRSKQTQVRAQTALALARALWAGTDPLQRGRARAIVAETIADAVAMGLAGPRLRRDLRTWLAEHE